MDRPNGDHDRLPSHVPPLCEHCYCPIFRPAFVITHQWPGTHGMRVFLHADCATQAAKQRR